MFNEKKRLSLDDFKEQAGNANLATMMDSIKGGVTDSCHTPPERGNGGGLGSSDKG